MRRKKRGKAMNIQGRTGYNGEIDGRGDVFGVDLLRYLLVITLLQLNRININNLLHIRTNSRR